MNRLLPYEQVVSEKIEHVSIPDMAESVWAAIETGLDGDLPENDPGGNDPASPSQSGTPAAPKFYYFAAGIVITAAVLITLFNPWGKKSPENSSPIHAPYKQDTAGRPLPVFDNEPLQKDNNISNQQAPGASGIDSNDYFSFPVTVNDSSGFNIPATTKDSSRNYIDSMQKVIPANSDLQPKQISPASKPKGLKGFSDSDYLIKQEKKN